MGWSKAIRMYCLGILHWNVIKILKMNQISLESIFLYFKEITSSLYSIYSWFTVEFDSKAIHVYISSTIHSQQVMQLLSRKCSAHTTQAPLSSNIKHPVRKSQSAALGIYKTQFRVFLFSIIKVAIIYEFHISRKLFSYSNVKLSFINCWIFRKSKCRRDCSAV